MGFAALAGYQIRFGAVKAPSRKRKLETSGIYGIIRHPIYFGDTFWVMGLSIMFNAAYSLLLTPLWLTLLFLFSIVEEEKLVEEYGEEYERYIQMVPKRIISWFYRDTGYDNRVLESFLHKKIFLSKLTINK